MKKWFVTKIMKMLTDMNNFVFCICPCRIVVKTKGQTKNSSGTFHFYCKFLHIRLIEVRHMQKYTQLKFFQCKLKIWEKQDFLVVQKNYFSMIWVALCDVDFHFAVSQCISNYVLHRFLFKIYEHFTEVIWPIILLLLGWESLTKLVLLVSVILYCIT